MVYGHCMAKSSAFLKQMSSESSSSLNIHYVLSFFFTVNIVRCSGVLRKKKRKFIPKPGLVYKDQGIVQMKLKQLLQHKSKSPEVDKGNESNHDKNETI